MGMEQSLQPVYGVVWDVPMRNRHIRKFKADRLGRIFHFLRRRLISSFAVRS